MSTNNGESTRQYFTPLERHRFYEWIEKHRGWIEGEYHSYREIADAAQGEISQFIDLSRPVRDYDVRRALQDFGFRLPRRIAQPPAEGETSDRLALVESAIVDLTKSVVAVKTAIVRMGGSVDV